MTFNKAYKIAMDKSESFRRNDANVKKAIESGERSACLLFSVEPGETFYYGFDGFDLHKGKHSKKRSAILLDREDAVLIIL